MATHYSTFGSGTAAEQTKEPIHSPNATDSLRQDTVIFARDGADNNMVSSTIEESSSSSRPAEPIEATSSRIRSKHNKRLKGRGKLSRKQQIAKVHEEVLTTTMNGDLVPAQVPEVIELFELGVMESSVLHLMSERWSIELAPLFHAVMEEASQRDEKAKLYLLKDELGRTILNRSRSDATKRAFIRFFFDSYHQKAIELLKSDPELLMVLISAWRQVNWMVVCQELHSLLPEPMRDHHQNPFLHRVVYYPLGSRRARVDDGDMMQTIISAVVEAEPSTLWALNGQGRSVYQLCAEAIQESHNISHGVDSPNDEDDDSDETDEYETDDDSGLVAGMKREHDHVSDENTTEKGLKSTETTATVLQKVSSMLKEQIFRFVNDVNQIRKLLYVGSKDAEIELDLSELGDIKDPDALSRLVTSAGLHIDGLLRYVKLPANKTDEPKHLEARQKALSKLFARLKDKNSVTTIVHLQVDESIDRPCSDQLIQSALSGIKIDTLEWRKTDMCAQVMIDAVPQVQKLHLYCSGNRGVLLSWSAADGLPSLPFLKKVYMSVLDDRVETRQSIEMYRKEFEQRLFRNIAMNRNGGKVTVEWRKLWMIQLRDFCMRMNWGIERPLPADNPPQVAIIDDGVSVVDFQSQEAISVVEGRSFASSRFSKDTKPWFFSTTGHGTVMTKIILSLSPKARLLVARADLSFHSIAQALRWCIKKQADIIYLGIAVDGHDGSEGSEIFNSLYEAVKEGITVLMPVFEAGIGEATTQQFEPLDGVLNIATSRWSEWAEIPAPRHADFTLMDDVSTILSASYEKEALKDIKGNSISTAIAAGLAATILCCVGPHIQSSRDFTSKQMRSALRSLLGPGDSKMILAEKLASLVSELHDANGVGRHFLDVVKSNNR